DLTACCSVSRAPELDRPAIPVRTCGSSQDDQTAHAETHPVPNTTHTDAVSGWSDDARLYRALPKRRGVVALPSPRPHRECTVAAELIRARDWFDLGPPYSAARFRRAARHQARWKLRWRPDPRRYPSCPDKHPGALGMASVVHRTSHGWCRVPANEYAVCDQACGVQ